MSLALRACSARSPRPRWALALPALAWALAGPAGCFDSDEQYVPSAETTSSTGLPPTTVDSSTSTSGGSSTTEEADRTCRDAIDCVVGCAIELQISMLPEPDFTCFLECEQGMTTEEVLHLYRLAECVTNQCIAAGNCDFLIPEESTSSDGGEGGSSSTGDTDGTRPPICLNCVLGGMTDLEPPGCMELAAACI